MTYQKISLVIIAFFIALSSSAQKRVGDMIESVNNNIDQSRSPRTQQYKPDGQAFLSINGNNRFTRALYGSHSDYRIETSDFPVFAIYNATKRPKEYRNLRFEVEVDGNIIELDKVLYCEARYQNGQRNYILKDNRWGKQAKLLVDVIALPDTEGALWRFQTIDFPSDKKVKIISKLCEIANKKLNRNGEMGADKPGSFEASPTEEGLVKKEIFVANKDVYAVAELHNVDLEEGNKHLEQLFLDAENHFRALCSRVNFTTPDPYLNTLGQAMVLAADGVWDGETWLHGAIGWRMPLAGWRAGYLGDVMGWNDRAISHFDAYANSQVIDKPVIFPGVSQDKELNLARAEKKWGTEMYSTGYICRNPNRNDQMHHYDMNLNYIDELLWHFEYDADTLYMKKMWPVLQRHLAWEKMNFDSDNDHLYDAYCCIWASDALYYSDGAVTHSSAYNYRGNLLAAKVARIIGEDPEPYQYEADAIRKAMNDVLWVKGADAYVPCAEDVDKGIITPLPAHWVEYKEKMGSGRLHPDAALWSVYTPIDCGVGSPKQMYDATRYVDVHIPHLNTEVHGNALVSTSDWLPYSWSINNVASAEIMHTALAYFKAGRAMEGRRLLMSNIMDQMYYGQSPANFGQINYYDAARGECYRDFGDNVGISSRAIIQGLFGIEPHALDDKCIIRPGFPLEWDSISVVTPYLKYKYRKLSPSKGVLDIQQNFTRPLNIIVRINGEEGSFIDFKGDSSFAQSIEFDIPNAALFDSANKEQPTTEPILDIRKLGLSYNLPIRKQNLVDLSGVFNASVTDIFNNEYRTPRPSSTTLQIPVQGVGEWCHPALKPEIDDRVYRILSDNNRFNANGLVFNSPQNGHNIIFTSLWDNYPSSVTIPVKKQKVQGAYLLMAGSTNHMQTRLDNGVVIANYDDGTSDTLRLVPPFNWCPIEQDYYADQMAFKLQKQRPIRVCLGNGIVSDNLEKALLISPTEVYGREITGGAAQILAMPLNPTKKLASFTLTTLANDVVIGLMGITLIPR